MNIKELHSLFLKCKKITTDTRNIIPNSIFFALKGANFNGNTFAGEALKKGASFAVVDEKKYATDPNTILVSNVLETLQELANYHRNLFNIPVIALTGSNGKTTTKELINSVLSQKYKTIATIGNLNNHIGVPLTLLNITSETEIAIIEMGANHLKEIANLSKIANPEYGYITNFGKAHLEGFGSTQGVIKAKSELYDYLIAKDGHIFLNADDPIQLEKLKSYIKKYGYSESKDNYFNITLSQVNPFVVAKTQNIELKSKLIGSYNFQNIAAAILFGKYFNVPLTDIKKAIESYTPSNNRSQLIEKGSSKFILDAYNANPTSVEAALKNMAILSDENKIIILGDMFELGKEAKSEHQRIAILACELPSTKTILIGENFYNTTTVAKKYKDFESFKSSFNKENYSDATILVKGSRGMALERILELF